VIPTDILCWEEGVLWNPENSKEVDEWLVVELAKGQYKGGSPMYLVFNAGTLHFNAVAKRPRVLEEK
jgi:hypothetical protein